MTQLPQPDLNLPPIYARSLETLYQHCYAQLAQFQLTRNPSVDSSSCDEILRRAASGDVQAFATLWEISRPLIRQHCPPAWRYVIDDVEQEVARRLVFRFQHSKTPYQAGSFAAYRTYVNTTLTSVCLHMRRHLREAETLDENRAELAGGDTYREVDRHLIFSRCEALLPDELHRAVFRRRIVHGEDIAAIVAFLQPNHPEITTKKVYRIAEHCIQLLSTLPEVRDMFESDGGNK